jgi:hypothetical protein
MSVREFAAEQLAASLLAGSWTERSLLDRARAVMWPTRVEITLDFIRALMTDCTTDYPPSPAQIVAYCLASPDFGPFLRHEGGNDRMVAPSLKSPRFRPTPIVEPGSVPALATLGELAEWLGISATELDWFSDARRQHGNAMTAPLQHYRYQFVAKASGARRLIEAPKPRLKQLQRCILHDILDRIPPHEAAHGFVAGRSCRTAAPIHVGEAVLLAVDLQDFFVSTPLRRVHGIFRSLGYPWAVARALTGICSTMTPSPVRAKFADWSQRQRLATLHLPQGAPTSPALANLAAFGLDVRIAGLARTLEANYTRYADDLCLSGGPDFTRRINQVLDVAGSIIRESGYSLNPAKTRIMRRGGRQQITGIVVNDHCNLPRDAFDRLKAILHNCATRGPAGQNHAGHVDFRAYLGGRVAWVEQINPARGQKLRDIFDAIDWN